MARHGLSVFFLEMRRKTSRMMQEKTARFLREWVLEFVFAKNIP